MRGEKIEKKEKESFFLIDISRPIKLIRGIESGYLEFQLLG